MAKALKPGDKVRWNTPQGETRGTVEKILTSKTRVGGHVAKADKDHPEALVRSAASGKTAAHRPDALKKA